jgi:hypothetical protein
MRFTNDEFINELLAKAHKIGKTKEVIDQASGLINNGTEIIHAFTLAYHRIVTNSNEIQRD